ncbi:hypothetical protein Bca101_025017 [Brassica carinata]
MRIKVDMSDGTCDFLPWKVRMLAQFEVLGLKSILDDDKLLKDPPTAKEELESTMKDPQKDLAGIAETVPNINPVKFKKSEKTNDLIVLNVGNKSYVRVNTARHQQQYGQR